jgi:hypothetical protein
MGISLQTNIASLVAQNNLEMNSQFQLKTITALTSGYRINSSADDAAGLAVANQYRSSVAELTQGVRNANDGISALQIVDGGLNNISLMLDRLKTLATQSASATFTGSTSLFCRKSRSRPTISAWLAAASITASIPFTSVAATTSRMRRSASTLAEHPTR